MAPNQNEDGGKKNLPGLIFPIFSVNYDWFLAHTVHKDLWQNNQQKLNWDKKTKTGESMKADKFGCT